MTVEIRLFQDIDEAAVRSLLRDAFENEAEADLVETLRHDGDMALEMVAQADDRIVGHIAYSALSAPVWALALAPLSVAPPYQKRGIGKALMEPSLRRVADKGWEAIFVLGDPHYYERFGFDAQLASVFNSEFQGSHFMALELVPNCLENKRGEIRHARAFGKLS